MGIEDSKIRLFVFLVINLIVIFAFRYWVLNNESFVWLLNGLPSWVVMEVFDPALQNSVLSGVKPLISLAIFTLLGSFFFGALLTAVRRGIKNEGWFDLKQEEDN